MANVNAAMLAKLTALVRVHVVNSAPMVARRGALYHLSKTVRALTGVIRIARARLAGARTFYASVDDGWGGIWTCLFTGTARLLRYRLFLHHHSFRYIAETTLPMRALTTIAGQSCRHVVLCPAMEAGLKARYRSIAATMIVPNVVDLPRQATPPRAGNGIVIGMMSNLLFEKGLREFVEIVVQGRAAGLPLRGVLAGPAPSPEVEAFLRDAVARIPELEWRGAVAGAAKEAFFTDIDVFVFPTRYRTEAYPLVLLEALVRGRPVVATSRGCIGALGGLSSVSLVAPDGDIVEDMVRALKDIPGTSEERATRARADAVTLDATGTAAQTRLIDTLVESAPVGLSHASVAS